MAPSFFTHDRVMFMRKKVKPRRPRPYSLYSFLAGC